MTSAQFLEQIIEAYGVILSASLPVTLFIAGCNLIFNTVVNAFTSGKLSFGGRQ